METKGVNIEYNDTVIYYKIVKQIHICGQKQISKTTVNKKDCQGSMVPYTVSAHTSNGKHHVHQYHGTCQYI